MIGGGDSKLGTALALWAGLRGLLPFVFYMALVGGILGIAALVLYKLKPFKNPRVGGWIEQAQLGANAIPYGIAISAGAWASFFHTGIVHEQIHEVFKIIH
jgi:prepilin peptidase CpaA